MSEYFPEPKSSGKVKIQLDWFNYATKADLKMRQKLIQNLLLKRLIQLVLIASNADKLDIDQLKNFPTNLSTLKS